MVLGGLLRDQLHAGSAQVSLWGERVGSVLKASGMFSSRRALQSKNELLSQRLAELEERAAAYAVVQSENEALRTLVRVVGTTTNQGLSGVTAPIVSSLRSSPYGTFMIGAGAGDGIVRDSIVLTNGGFVVGIVSDTSVHTAVVTEIFSPQASFETLIGGALVTAQGRGGGNARAQVPRGLSINPGDAVIAPALGQRAIGIVGAVASSSASASQDVYIRLPINLASLQYVYIIPAH
jgi:cell shape-determining protein MreC